MSAAALLVLGIPAATGTASATSSTQTFQLTNSGAKVTVVGTSTWTPTEAAGPTGAMAPSGSTALTPAAAKSGLPRVPDLGVTPRGTSTIATAPGSSKGNSASAHGHVTPGGPTATPGQVTGPTSGLMSVAGSDAYNQGVLHPVYTKHKPQPLPGVDVEPPDQGLCAGNGYVMEMNNMVVQMYTAHTASTMVPLSKNGMALEKLFNAPEVFGATGGGTVSVQGDPRCYYDQTTGHWFASQIWLTVVDGSPTFGWAGEFVAVSATTNPTGSWHVYFIPDQFNAHGVDGCNNISPKTRPTNAHHSAAQPNPCYGDQPLLGVNSNAVFISVNEYTLEGSKVLGGVGTEYALSKTDLINGTASPIFWGHLGDTVPQPGNPTCPYATQFGQPTQVICPWYSIVPAVSDGSYVNTANGTFYAVSNVTFTTSGGHQVALWTFTNTAAVTTDVGHITGSVTVTTTVPYAEPPVSAVKGTTTLYESLAPQKAGPHPLGTLWEPLTGATPITWPTGEGMIATNTDRVTTAAYDPTNGSVWAALNTAARVRGHTEAGIAWFRVTPSGSGSTLTTRTVVSGYVAAPTVNDFFPSIAFTKTGKGVMDYVLTGKGYYPSTGYSFVGASGPTPTLHVARPGVGPADGFSEYTATYDRPRWGDYSTAVATGTTFFFAAEMVNQSCTVTTFKATFTCHRTRDLEANWGTSVNKLPAG